MDILNVVKRNPYVLSLACLAAVAMLLISEGSYRHAAGTLEALGTMAEARLNIRSLERNVLAAEAGQRGYLLSGESGYRAAYDAAIKDIGESLQFLQEHYRASPRALAVVSELRSVIRTGLSELEQRVRLFDEGKPKPTTEIKQGGVGKEQMDAIRRLGSELLRHEVRSAEAGRNDIYQTLLFNRIGVALLSSLSLLALVMYLRQNAVLVRQQQEQQRLVQTERDRLEIEVGQRTAQLTELTHHLQTAREDERSRLARDLHDELGALLTSAKLDAARIRSRLGSSAPEALERLTHLVETLNSGIALKRRIIEDLRPSALSNLGLVATLEILAREFAAQSGVEVHCALEAVKLDADAELTIYRLVQEAITNIAKYANAKQVWISLAMQDGKVRASVRDDGVGFDAAKRTDKAHGLVGMRFRVEAEGGTLAVVSAPGQGTLIRVTLPAATSPTA